MANHEMSMESIDSGSNYSFGDKLIKGNAPKSLFDLTHLSSMDIYNAGIMFPICQPIECIMSDDMEISVASLIRVMPQEVPLYSRQRLYIYGFYSRCSDLWCNWNTFAKKGMLGKTIKKIPTLNKSNCSSGQYNETNGKVTANSLMDYMGIPIGLDCTGNTWGNKINAMPFMMWARVKRDYFSNKNTIANNPILFPDNDDEFRLDDDGRLISAKKYDYQDDEDVWHRFNLIFGSSGTADADTWEKNNKVKYGFDVGEEYDPNSESEFEPSDIRIGLYFHDWPDDRFTDALPWPQRGDTPSIELSPSAIFQQITEDGAGVGAVEAKPYLDWEVVGLGKIETQTNDGEWRYSGDTNDILNVGYPVSDTSYGYTYDAGDNDRSTRLKTTQPSSNSVRVNLNKLVTGLNARIKENMSGSITLNQIRELAIAQTELEKMARTDGTYLGFALTFFDERPKNAVDYKPVYIGGTYTDLQFTEVLQTGASTDSSPLGTYAGHGIAGNSLQQGYIGKIHCDDYGYIMLIGCIMPDVYYTQKLDKMWTRSLQSDIYLPERAKMGMVPILNHEIDALHAPEGKTLFDLWAYNNPFDELRYLANEVHGQLADSTAESFFCYTQSRHFDAAPNWGKTFSEASDVRTDYLAAGNQESAYTAQFKINIRAVRPLPYKPVPAQII